MIKAHCAKQSWKFMNAECILTVTLSSLLNVHMHMSEHINLTNVYATAKKPKGYSLWSGFVATFSLEQAKPWHETTRDSWG
jgi:hypothetical protein